MVKIKSLVTGIGGFVAKHLMDYLLEQGEEVHGSYRWNEDLQRIKNIDKSKVKLISADICDLSSMIRMLKQSMPNYIYHLAAQSYVPPSFDYPNFTIQVNTIGTLNLLEAVKIIREEEPSFDPVIHICSSSEVYGQVEEKDVPIKETQNFNPSNFYAVGKVGADMLGLLYYKIHGLKVIRTRMFTHTGPGRTMLSAECNFAKQIAEIEKNAKSHAPTAEIPIYSLKHGNLDSVRTWTDVRDAVRAYYIMMRKCKPGEVYNIGGVEQHKIGEMLDYLISQSPLKDKIKKEQDPSLMRLADVTLQIPDVSKFKEATGWEPVIKFEETMRDLLDFWRDSV